MDWLAGAVTGNNNDADADDDADDGTNGWDDEDDLGDFSDQSLEELPDHQTQETDPSSHDVVQHHHHRHHHQYHHTEELQQDEDQEHSGTEKGAPGTVTLGGGMFMGRLTRLIEAVTHPDSEEENDHYNEDTEGGDIDGDGDGGGWDDEDDLEELIDDDDDDDDDEDPVDNENGNLEITEDPGHENRMQGQQQQQQQSSNVVPVPLSDMKDDVEYSNRLVPPTPTSELMDSGWDDDLDLNIQLDQPEETTCPPSTDEENRAAGEEAQSASSPSQQNLFHTSDFKNDELPATNESLIQIPTEPMIPLLPSTVSMETPPPASQQRQISNLSIPYEDNDNDDDDDGWDQDDIAIDIKDEDVDAGPLSSLSISQPPASNENSLAAVATSIDSSGWDNDDDDDIMMTDIGIEDVLEDVAEDNGKGNENITVEQTHTNQQDQMVDLLPPPPPPPRDSKITESSVAAVAVTEDGWEDDDVDVDVDLDNDIDELNGMDAATSNPPDDTPIVDHTPPPPPPPPPQHQRQHVSEKSQDFIDGATEAATVDENDDDISRDDTLSIANSRAARRGVEVKPQSPILVDQIPTALNQPVTLQRSETMDAVRGSNSVGSSTVDDYYRGEVVISEPSEVIEEQTIVDHIPNSVDGVSSMSRSDPNEASMRILGGSSVGGYSGSIQNTGSVSSIGSHDKLSDRGSDYRRSRRMVDKTPSIGRFHRGVLNDTSLGVAGHVSVGESLDSIDEEGEELESSTDKTTGNFVININRSSFQFGSTISALSTGGGIPRTTAEHDEDSNSDAGRPLVDQTPLIDTKNRSMAASVEVLSVSSEEGDLGESIVGIDDVKDDLYGNVVDHTPATPNPAERPRLSLRLPSNAKQEDDTVVGVAEQGDVETDIKADDDMDDESSRGTKLTQEDIDNRSLISTVRLTIPEERHLVDRIPTNASKTPRTTDASTAAFADGSEGTIRGGEDDIVNDDDTLPAGYGPIVDHTPSVHFRSSQSQGASIVSQNSGVLAVGIKEDDAMDNTVGLGTSVADEDGWDGDQNSLTVPVSTENHLVDHIPTLTSRQGAVDASMRVGVDNPDDATQIDTIAEDAVTEFGPIVDHTPFTSRNSGASLGPSVTTASIATVPFKTNDDLDDPSEMNAVEGWDNDIPDLEDISAGDADVIDEDIHEPTVVDHVPRKSFPRSTDASTMVLVDPNEEASAGDDYSANNTGGADRFGPVVDQTPAPPKSSESSQLESSLKVQIKDLHSRRNTQDYIEDGATWFGASTLGASGEESTRGDSSEGGWDDGLDALAVSSSTHAVKASGSQDLVDHVPEIPMVRPGDASTAVVIDPSTASSQNKEEIGGAPNEASFGAIVDHTPSVNRATSASIGNSILTVATGVVTDIKPSNEIEDNESNADDSQFDDDADGWAQNDNALAELEEEAENERPPLVDHVPDRPDPRPTDVSTLVAGEPSEIFSQVDDLGQDETHFGPVVDHLPRPQQNFPASAAGSTIVNIASVVEDDLDAAVEKDIDGEDLRLLAREQTGWQAPVPNPQCGNEEEKEDPEQLVDYVPDENQAEVPDLIRDASSEMATLGEKSNALPADDPKEDEFGPVVDQLPIPIPEEGKSGSAHEESNTVFSRNVLTNSAKQIAPTIDSVAPHSDASKISKTDALDDDEFGPVVDHLPLPSSRASVSLSRGGSTVDALATVSEVGDDYVAGDGWEDDVEIGSDMQETSGSPSRSDDRNLSVKWVDGLNGENKVDGENDDITFEKKNEVSRPPLNETRYYDPEVENSSGWSELVPSDSSVKNSVIVNEVDTKDMSCKQCAGSSSVDCPCVKQLIAEAGQTDELFGTLKTPEGRIVKVDFKKLLGDEMTKRQLVEKEFKSLCSTIESLNSSKDSLVLAGETQLKIMENLQSTNKALADKNQQDTAKSIEVQSQNEELQARNSDLEENFISLQQQSSDLIEERVFLRKQIDTLELKIEELTSALESKSTWYEKKINEEITPLKKSHEALNEQIKRFETECQNLRGKNESLYEDLETYKQTISVLEIENAALKTKEVTLNAEIQRFKTTQEEKLAGSARSLEQQIQCLQDELFEKNKSFSGLNAQLASMRTSLNASEAEKFRQTKDLAKLGQDKQKILSDFESLQESKELLQSSLSEKESMISSLKGQLAHQNRSAAELMTEKLSLEKRLNENLQSHQDALGQKERQLMTIDQELSEISQKLENVEEEKASLVSAIDTLNKKLQASEAQKRSVDTMAEQKEYLKKCLDDANSSISRMESQIEELKSKNMHSSSLNSEINELQEQRDKLSSQLASTADKFEEASLQIFGLEANKEQLEQKLLEMESKLTSSSSLEQAHKDMEQQIHSLRDQVSLANERSHSFQKEYTESRQQNLDFESRLSQVSLQLEAVTSERDHFKGLLQNKSRESENENVLEYQELELEVTRLREVCNEQAFRIESLIDSERKASDLSAANTSLVSKIQKLEGEIAGFSRQQNKLDKLEMEHNFTIQQLKAELEEVRIQRDTFLEERKMLEQENEEMLVQFGLLKEDIDQTDSFVEKLQVERDELASAVEEKNKELIDTKERLQSLSQNSNSEAEKRLLGVQGKMDVLLSENGQLEEAVKGLTKKNSVFESNLKNIDAEKKSLLVELNRMESDATRSKEEYEKKNIDLLSTIRDLQATKEDMKNEKAANDKEIHDMKSALEKSRSVEQENVLLSRRLEVLESTLMEREQVVEQKNGAITDLQNQLHAIGKEPRSNAELETLKRTIREMRDSADMDRSTVQELERVSNNTAKELQSTLDKLAQSELTIMSLRDELLSKKSQDVEMQELRERLRATQERLEQANQDTSAFRTESTDLRGRLSALETEIENYRHNPEQPAKEPSGQSSTEIQLLREQIETLKQQQISSSSETGAREEVIEREVHLLQQQMRQKDGEIGKLERQLESLDSDLSNKHKELQSKQQYVDRLNTELEILRSESTTSQVFEFTSENSEKLRQQIISLAKALEQSESRRAVAIERLENERQANADSLRRLTESVKRFYSTLSLGSS